MRVPDVEDVVRSVREIEDARYGGGAEEHEIADLEQSLGLIFPLGFRTFLLHMGWASVRGIAIYGLGEEVPSDLDLRTVVAENRPRLPANAVPFAREGGAIFCLDAAHPGPYESPAYRWMPDASAENALEYTGHDFASWLWMRLAERT